MRQSPDEPSSLTLSPKAAHTDKPSPGKNNRYNKRKQNSVFVTSRSGSLKRVAAPLQEPLNIQQQLEKKADNLDL